MALTKVIGAGLGKVASSDLDGAVTINESSADVDFRVESNGNANMLFVDGGNDRVGIGTSSPQDKFVISNNDAYGLEINPYEGSDTVRMMALNRTNLERVPLTLDASVIIFQKSTVAEFGRWDNTGNLLVGTTDINPYDNTSGVGIALRSSGAIYNAIDGGTPLVLNRMTNDGTIAQFRQGGSIIGNIDSRGGVALTINSQGGNGRLGQAGTTYYEWNTTRFAPVTDTVGDLGRGVNRWKDLYLSGKLTNNGTGGINIDTSGNVGIGTTAPNATLNVNGTVELAGVLYRGIFGGTYQDSDINALFGGNPAAVQIQSASSNRPATLLLGGSQGTNEALGTIGFYNSGNTDTKRLRSYIYGGQEGGTSNEQGGVLVFGTASDTGTTPAERMRIDSSGRVGIITSSPSTYLEIGRDGQAGAINSTYHKDTFASMLITGNEARLQIAASDGGSDAAMLLLSSGTNNWAVRANGPSAGNRFAIGYYSSSSDGNIGSYSTLTKSLEIETNGAVTMPSQPAFRAHKANNVSQFDIGSSATTVTFGGEIFDTNSDYNATTDTFTAPVDGTYLFHYALRLQSIDSASSYYNINLSTSNRGYNSIFSNDRWSADLTYWTPMRTVIADMDAGDTAHVEILFVGGTAQTDISGSANYTVFSGCLIG